MLVQGKQIARVLWGSSIGKVVSRQQARDILAILACAVGALVAILWVIFH